MTPKAQAMKTKINEWDHSNLQSFCTLKEEINKMKRQPMEWEKIFADLVSDDRLKSKIDKALIQLNSKKTNKQTKKNQLKNLTEKTFSQRIHTTGQQVMKRCSISSIITSYLLEWSSSKR